MNFAGANTNYRTKVDSNTTGLPVQPADGSTVVSSTILDFNVSQSKVLAVDTVLDKLVLADKDTVDHALNVVGITLNAALTGEAVRYATSGLVEELTGLVPGKVWLDTAGGLTQTPPTTGFRLCLGTVLPAGDAMILNISNPIIRS